MQDRVSRVLYEIVPAGQQAMHRFRESAPYPLIDQREVGGGGAPSSWPQSASDAGQIVIRALPEAVVLEMPERKLLVRDAGVRALLQPDQARWREASCYQRGRVLT